MGRRPRLSPAAPSRCQATRPGATRLLPWPRRMTFDFSCARAAGSCYGAGGRNMAGCHGRTLWRVRGRATHASGPDSILRSSCSLVRSREACAALPLLDEVDEKTLMDLLQAKREKAGEQEFEPRPPLSPWQHPQRVLGVPWPSSSRTAQPGRQTRTNPSRTTPGLSRSHGGRESLGILVLSSTAS
ncbi:hypothetical protein GGR56DRAFT_248628 [Xylariaceae sp. FL0804]|nr:hypothetical protein GGR56DRAFT_248628 [Xylariaceae sp. FL0804]